MGGPKYSAPPTPPPAPDYADQAAKVANQLKVRGSRRRSFLPAPASSMGNSTAGIAAFAGKTLLGQ